MKTILFVDDEVSVLDALERMLRKEGFHRIYCTDPQEAKQILEKEDVDVMVTDLLMPGLNGLNLLNMSRQISPKTVRVVLSGDTHSGMILSAMNEGEAFRYLTKPWRIDGEALRVLHESLEYSDFLRNHACADD